MTDSVTLYRLWREAANAGLTISPVDYRSESGELLDHAYNVTGPGLDNTQVIVIGDLGSWLARWLADLYRDPAARAQAAARALASYPGRPGDQ